MTQERPPGHRHGLVPAAAPAVGRDHLVFVTTLLDELPEADRVVWTHLQNTSDSGDSDVRERAPVSTPESSECVLRVATGSTDWRLARDAVREQAGGPVQTWYVVTEVDSDIQALLREESPY